MMTDHARREPPKDRRVVSLAVLAFGIVCGDIGTCPLYAIRECFHSFHPVAVDRGNVLGVLSLIFSSLIIVVTLKYHVYVLRFNNRGESGIDERQPISRPASESGRGAGRPDRAACCAPGAGTAYTLRAVGLPEEGLIPAARSRLPTTETHSLLSRYQSARE